MGKELDRFDVGIAVHHTARFTAVGIAAFLGNHAGARGKPEDKADKRSDPERHGQRDPKAHLRQQQERDDGKSRGLPEGLECQKGAVFHGDAGCHHPVGQPPCEIVLKEADRLAQHVAVRPPADLRHHVGGDAAEQDHRVDAHGDGPQEEQKNSRKCDLGPVCHPKPLGPGGHQVNQSPGVPDQAKLQDRHNRPGQSRPAHDGTKAAHVVENEAQWAGVRCLGIVGRERVNPGFGPAHQREEGIVHGPTPPPAHPRR